MRTVFCIQRSDGLFLSKQQWVAPTQLKHAFFADSYDVALNELIERNSKNIDERMAVVACIADDKGRPCAAAAGEHA